MRRAFLFLSLIASTANAHDAPTGWRYDAWCCSGSTGGSEHAGDCAPIPSKAVKPIKGGYQVTLHAGDHHMITKDHVFFVPYQVVRQSGDDRYHSCFFPTEDTLRCFYAPPQSY